MVKVRGMGELLKADRQVENLSCAIEGPDFGLLQEFVALRALRVEQDHDLPHPTLVQSAWSLALVEWSFHIAGNGVGPGPDSEDPLPDFACLADLPHLQRIELRDPSLALEQAIRKAAPARVRIDILPR